MQRPKHPFSGAPSASLKAKTASFNALCAGPEALNLTPPPARGCKPCSGSPCPSSVETNTQHDNFANLSLSKFWCSRTRPAIFKKMDTHHHALLLLAYMIWVSLVGNFSLVLCLQNEKYLHGRRGNLNFERKLQLAAPMQ